MDRLDPGEADVDGAIDRGPGPVEDADHGERLVVVRGEVGRGDAVRDDDLVTDLVAEVARHVGSQHRVVDLLESVAGVERQRLACCRSGRSRSSPSMSP